MVTHIACIWLIFPGTPEALYHTQAHTRKSVVTFVHVHTHVDSYTHTHSGGKMTLESFSEAFVAQLFSIQTSCSSCSISFVFGHVKSPQCFLCVLICFYILWDYQMLWTISLFLSLSKLLKAHLQQASDPFRLLLCKANLRGMMHFSKMLSLG